MSDRDHKPYKYQSADKDVPSRPPMPTELDREIEAAGIASNDADDIPRPPTPTELDWQVDAAHRSGKHISFDITPPPANQDTDHGTETKRPPTLKPGQDSSLFVPFGPHEGVYKNTSLANFPVAGQLKDRKLAKCSESKAKMSMEADGVQHPMYAAWQKQRESGAHSQKKE